MSKSTSKVESTYLIVSATGTALIGCVGLAFASIADSQAILLDGVFNLTYFVMGLFTLKVAKLVRQRDTEEFPYGFAFFEPLINGVKGVLVLGVTMMATVGAVQALVIGGRVIATGPAVGYGVFASAVCWGMAIATHRGAKRTGSPLIGADAENWIVNASISSAVLLTFVGLLFLEGTALEPFAPYVDPVLVLVVVTISISVPIRMAWKALMELLNRAPAPEITRQVRRTVETCIADLPVQKLFVRVLQPGRTRMVMAHVVPPTR